QRGYPIGAPRAPFISVTPLGFKPFLCIAYPGCARSVRPWALLGDPFGVAFHIPSFVIRHSNFVIPLNPTHTARQYPHHTSGTLAGIYRLPPHVPTSNHPSARA